MLKWIVVAALTFAAVLLFMGATASPEEQAQELTEINLKQLLKDPDSMKIKSSFIVKKPADKKGDFDISVYDVVDGKNGFGGYTGGIPFVGKSAVFNGETHFISINIEDPTDKKNATQLKKLSAFEEIFWNKYCVDATHQKLQFKE